MSNVLPVGQIDRCSLEAEDRDIGVQGGSYPWQASEAARGALVPSTTNYW